MHDKGYPERGPAQRPPITPQLLAKGPLTLGHETNLARAPLWNVRERPVQLAIPNLVLYGTPFRQTAGSPLTVSDQRLLAELTTAYVRDACPAHRKVEFSLTEAARVLGHENIGGGARQLVRQSLTRLRSVTLESATRFPDGGDAVLVWGLLDKALIRQPRTGPGRGWAMLSEEIAQLLRHGSVTYLHAPTWDAIAAQDEIAGRLWSFLEAEQLAQGYRYQLFAAPPGDIAQERNMPAITELLRVNWVHRRKAADRIRRACAVLVRTDSRYQLDVIKSKRSGMWRLEARRSIHLGQGPRGPLPPSVAAVWRTAYSGQQPSKKQVAVLQELVERRGSLWVTVRMSQGGADPFQATLAADREQNVIDRKQILARDRAWEEEKLRCQEPADHGPFARLAQAANGDGPQALATILSGFLSAPQQPADGSV